VTSITDAYGNAAPGLTASLATPSQTVSSPTAWVDALTITAASGATPPLASGTYYVIVQGKGDGYTDSVVLSVTVTVPNVAVTSPGNNAVYPTSTKANPTVLTVSATADAADGTSPLNTLAIFADGTATCSGSTNSVSGTWSPTTDGAHTIYAEATYANGAVVDSAKVTVYSGKLTVTGGNWQPDNAVVGEETYGDSNASVSGGLDSDGSGLFFAIYSWTTASQPSPDPVTHLTTVHTPRRVGIP
jgi:hypothetical protein